LRTDVEGSINAVAAAGRWGVASFGNVATWGDGRVAEPVVAVMAEFPS